MWPLNPNGELVNFTIVESKEGLAKVREIAAVKGIGVLFPGAGTLRGVFTTTDANGQRVFDEAAWEGAIQQVLVGVQGVQRRRAATRRRRRTSRSGSSRASACSSSAGARRDSGRWRSARRRRGR